MSAPNAVLIDKRHNLSRGFADLKTPSVVEKELLFSWLEKREFFKDKLKAYNRVLDKEECPSKRGVVIHHRKKCTLQLEALGQKINKRVSSHLLLIDRLRQECTEDQFNRASFLAREDKQRILNETCIEDSL
jgi:hypothetical protein